MPQSPVLRLIHPVARHETRSPTRVRSKEQGRRSEEPETSPSGSVLERDRSLRWASPTVRSVGGHSFHRVRVSSGWPCDARSSSSDRRSGGSGEGSARRPQSPTASARERPGRWSRRLQSSLRQGRRLRASRRAPSRRVRLRRSDAYHSSLRGLLEPKQSIARRGPVRSVNRSTCHESRRPREPAPVERARRRRRRSRSRNQRVRPAPGRPPARRRPVRRRHQRHRHPGS
jgi:hypothetical protein